jgi:glycosyltransferase involved in cell wall biosynthesis
VRLKNIILKEQFQVIDTQNIQSKFWGSITASLSGVTFVSTLNSSYQNEFGQSVKGKLYSSIDQWTNRRADGYIAVSKPIQDDLLKTGVASEMVDVVTNAVEIDDTAQADDPRSIRRQIGVPDECQLCVSVGRLVWAKGYDDFIKAFASVSSQVPNAYAVILGGGELHSVLWAEIQDAGLTKRIILFGHCEPKMVLSVLKASDIFVMSSRSEGVPYALLEAAAQGLPILATQCGGIPEILTHEMDAILVPAGNPAALSMGMIKLLTDRSLSKQLGANAKTTIQQRFSLPVQIEATRQAYLKALGHRLQSSN